ncbi:hypothetical protein SNE40_013020 [Patella caerulea]|uniref:Uncharacterized protein n=1 Tax=Patella caerulea TaxID=87958 RepID=A0AAN8JK36_PATCE
MRLPRFQELRQAVEKFAELGQYAIYLRDKNKKSQELHCRETVSGKNTMMSGNANYLRPISLIQKYKPLKVALHNLCDYQPVCVNEYVPLHTQMKSKYMNRITLPFCYEMIWCSQGNNKIWFIWKIPHNHGQWDINKSLEISKEIEDKHIEHYHSRVMRQKFVEHYERIILNPKKCSSATVLEEIYQDLTG